MESFIASLMDEFVVVAPVKKQDNVKGSSHLFSELNSPGEVDLGFTNTVYPPKDIFLPNQEALMRFNEKGVVSPETFETKRVLFGVRPCDANAISVMDRVFLSEPVDPYYKEKRDNTLIMPMVCSQAGPRCFCSSMGTDMVKGGYDLLFHPMDGYYLVNAGSKRGREFVKEDIFTPIDEVPGASIQCTTEVREDGIQALWDNLDHQVWEEAASRCLSCTACSVTCPTCTCFNMEDIPDLDVRSATRVRRWSSCQLKDFTRVAGDFSFRDERTFRLRHRILHKFIYFKERFGGYMCVGCGRCITQCPTGIDMLEIIKEISS